MATITEDYCSQELYRFLREKGFDGEVHTTFDKEGYTQPSITLQMAMKWLREVHNVACFICPSIEQGFHTNKWNSYVDKLSDNFPKDPLWFVGTSDSYEEACEVTIKYCLENLV